MKIQNEKYETTGETIVHIGVTLHRIKAIKTFGYVTAGALGGFISCEANLSASGNAWVSGNARVSGDARVSDNARVSGNAWVYGDAWVSGNAWVYGNARVYGNAWVSGNAWVYGDARVYGNARVSGNARVYGDAWVYGDARVYGDAHYITISPIGGEAGCLTAWVQKDGSIRFTRGCFYGTKAEFLAAVEKKHGKSSTARQYELCVALVEERLKT